MGEGLKSEILQLFTEKLDEIRTEFEEEGKQRRKMMNRFFIGSALFVLTFAFSAGAVVQKVASLEKNFYEVKYKVEKLYIIAVKNGDIEIE